MSQFVARIDTISSIESLNIVTFTCANQKLQMVSLELNPLVKEGRDVKIICKPTAVALAKPTKEMKNLCSVLSYANQLNVTIVSIDKGVLLSSIMLRFGEFSLESIMNSDAIDRLDLKEGDEVIALLKSNELAILEVLSD